VRNRLGVDSVDRGKMRKGRMGIRALLMSFVGVESFGGYWGGRMMMLNLGDLSGPACQFPHIVVCREYVCKDLP